MRTFTPQRKRQEEPLTEQRLLAIEQYLTSLGEAVSGLEDIRTAERDDADADAELLSEEALEYGSALGAWGVADASTLAGSYTALRNTWQPGSPAAGMPLKAARGGTLTAVAVHADTALSSGDELSVGVFINGTRTGPEIAMGPTANLTYSRRRVEIAFQEGDNLELRAKQGPLSGTPNIYAVLSGRYED